MKNAFAASRLFLALIVAMMVFSVLPSSTYAKPKEPARKEHVAVERAFAEQRRALEKLTQRLSKADARAAKMATWIGKVKAKGKDTTALDAALATFKDRIAAARSSWSAAQSTLTTHAGFDDAGKVVDVDQARATVKQARSQLESVRQTVKQAYGELRAAIAAFRKANRGVEDPKMPVEE